MSCWELNSGPLQGRQVPLTAEPPLQHMEAWSLPLCQVSVLQGVPGPGESDRSRGETGRPRSLRRTVTVSTISQGEAALLEGQGRVGHRGSG